MKEDNEGDKGRKTNNKLAYLRNLKTKKDKYNTISNKSNLNDNKP